MSRRLSICLIIVLVGFLPTIGAVAAETGLPLPRFASLGTDKANMRTGPGKQYPIDWVLLRRGMPVKIVAEFGHWRKIEDFDGVVGWVHQGLLSGERRVVVTDEDRTLRSEASGWSAPVALLEPGVIADVISCNSTWCNVTAGGITGWIGRSEVWGLLPGEVIE